MFSINKEKSLIYQKVLIFPLFEEVYDSSVELLDHNSGNIINSFLNDRH